MSTMFTFHVCVSIGCYLCVCAITSNPSVAVYAMDCFAAQEFIEIRRRFWKLCPAVHDSSEKPPDYSEVVIIQGMQTVWMRGTQA